MDGVITEDSDLLLFGAQKMIFKLGPEYTGKELDLQDIYKVTHFSELRLKTSTSEVGHMRSSFSAASWQVVTTSRTQKASQ